MSEKATPGRFFAMLQREIQEYRGSFLVTPLVVALCLSCAMLISVVLANRISVMGDALLEVILSEETAGMNISIHIDEEKGTEEIVYVIEEEGIELPPEDWDFSKEWKFKPDVGPKDRSKAAAAAVDSVNPLLNGVHSLMLLVLIVVTVGYLLNSFFQDRRDRSVLFWKSMPVSEWEEVLSKLAVAAIVAPAIFIIISLSLQCILLMLSMLAVWRRDMDPFVVVLGNLELGRLLISQIGGWFLAALYVAPLYAWLMLASAWARRSPFLAAVTPVLGLVLMEELFLGSSYVASAVGSHIPHFVGGGTEVGFYFFGAQWSGLDYRSLGSGLVVAALLLAGVVYLRRYRFER